MPREAGFASHGDASKPTHQCRQAQRMARCAMVTHLQHGSACNASYTDSFTRCVAPRVRRNSPRAASERRARNTTSAEAAD
eukprot:15299836-Alexandrium_andersonii.AAC.1